MTEIKSNLSKFINDIFAQILKFMYNIFDRDTLRRFDMPTSDTSSLFQKVRRRMVWEYERRHELGLIEVEEHSYAPQETPSLDKRTLTRNNNRRHTPRTGTINEYMNAQLNVNEVLMVPRQYAQEELCRQAISAMKNNASTCEIHRLIVEGLAITQLNESDYIDIPLFAFEPLLFHTLAKLKARDGNLPAAIEILTNVLANIEKFPPDDKTREKQIAPMLLSLARFQLQLCDYTGALATCEIGFDVAVKRNYGQYCPEFIHTKIMTLLAMGEKKLCEPLLTKAYAGYVALNNAEAANDILTISREHFGTDIQTHGIDTLLKTMRFAPPTKHNHAPMQFTNLGDILRAFHEESGVSRKNLCNGLCHVSMFSKLETNSIKHPNIFLIEAITQRMGKDIDMYYELHATIQEYDMWQLRDKIEVLARARKYTQLEEPLKELEDMEARHRNEYRTIKQFIVCMRATMRGETIKKDDIFLNMLQEAMEFTIPNFNLQNIKNCPLTVQEAIIINQMAMYYETIKDELQAIRIYEDLLHNIGIRWLDSTLKSRMYTNVSFNYSSCLGRMGQRRNALAIIEKALEYGVMHSNLRSSFDLFFNKGYNLFKLVGKEESLPWIILSYYGDSIFENHGTAKGLEIVREFVKDVFDISLY